MSRRATVLVTAAGTVVAQGIMKSLRLASSKRGHSISYRLVTADMSPQAAGIYRGDAGVTVPSADSPDYVESVVRLCRREGVAAVFCGSDEELPVLERARSRILIEGRATLIVNSGRVISVGGDKWRTYRILKRKGLPCAESALAPELRDFVDRHGLPVVVKPRQGHGSEGVSVARSMSEAREAVERLERQGIQPMLQEYLGQGDQEFTAGVTSDRDARVLSSIAMRRTLKSGQTSKAFVEDFPLVRSAAERVAVALESVGPLNVQSRIDDGLPKVFEVNPRFSASCPIRAVAGINEPDILYRNWVLGESPGVKHVKEVVAFRYWNEVYVDRNTYEETARSGEARPKASFIPGYF